MELAEAWMRQKHLVPTIIIQVAGCDLKSAQKLVRVFLHLWTVGQNGNPVLVQGDTEEFAKPPVDLVPTLLAAGEPLL